MSSLYWAICEGNVTAARLDTVRLLIVEQDARARQQPWCCGLVNAHHCVLHDQQPRIPYQAQLAVLNAHSVAD